MAPPALWRRYPTPRQSQPAHEQRWFAPNRKKLDHCQRSSVSRHQAALRQHQSAPKMQAVPQRCRFVLQRHQLVPHRTRVRPLPMQIFRSLPALLSSAHNRPTPTQSRSPSIGACFLEIYACTFSIGAILKLTRKPRRNVTFSLWLGRRCRVNRVNRRQQWPCLNSSFCPLLTPTPRRVPSSR